MKKNTVFTGVVLFFLLFVIMNQPVLTLNKNRDGLSWKSFNEGLQLAQQQKKPVLVDFYTDWCGWCKKMDEATYKNKDVVKLLSEKFIVIKLNPEKNAQYSFNNQTVSGSQLARMFGVRGYPATGFFDASGQFITIVPGYIPPETFLPILSYIQGKWYDKMGFEEFQKKQNAQK